MQLLSKEKSNPKIAKGANMGYETAIMHLSPARLSGHEVCASRSKGCTIACLNTSGHGKTNMVQQARMNRTLMFFNDRKAFQEQLIIELGLLCRRCDKKQIRPACRLNGTSDLVWEVIWPELFDMFPQIQFYDYTKHYTRCLLGYALPSNYHLTFSRSEKNDTKCDLVLKNGVVNVVAVFKDKNFPEKFRGYPTYSADETDLRFLDPKGLHVGCLYAKGKAKHDTTGFVL